MNWWDQDLSNWPGPDREFEGLKIGTIMAHRSNPHVPIGTLLSTDSGITTVQQSTELWISTADGLSAAFYESDLMPYSAG